MYSFSYICEYTVHIKSFSKDVYFSLIIDNRNEIRRNAFYNNYIYIEKFV